MRDKKHHDLESLRILLHRFLNRRCEFDHHVRFVHYFFFNSEVHVCVSVSLPTQSMCSNLSRSANPSIPITSFGIVALNSSVCLVFFGGNKPKIFHLRTKTHLQKLIRLCVFVCLICVCVLGESIEEKSYRQKLTISSRLSATQSMIFQKINQTSWCCHKKIWKSSLAIVWDIRLSFVHKRPPAEQEWVRLGIRFTTEHFLYHDLPPPPPKFSPPPHTHTHTHTHCYAWVFSKIDQSLESEMPTFLYVPLYFLVPNL